MLCERCDREATHFYISNKYEWQYCSIHDSLLSPMMEGCERYPQVAEGYRQVTEEELTLFLIEQALR